MPVTKDLLEGQGYIRSNISRALRTVTKLPGFARRRERDEGRARQDKAGQSRTRQGRTLSETCSLLLLLYSCVSAMGAMTWNGKLSCPPAFPARHVNREPNRLGRLAAPVKMLQETHAD